MRPALALLAPLSSVLACAHPGTTPAPVGRPAAAATLATLPIPGDRRLVVLARDIIDVRIALAPNLAAEAGLVEDAVRVPSFAPAAVDGLVARLDADLEGLRALPWDHLSVDEQIDLRWLQANAEQARQELVVERRWEHRPAQWLEPVSADLIALQANAPGRPDLSRALCARLPAMVDEMRALVVHPTQRDVQTAHGLLSGMARALLTLPTSPEQQGALEALQAYDAALPAEGTGLGADEAPPEYQVVGAADYDWRLAHALLLPWDADGLLAQAQAELDRVDAELAGLHPAPASPPTPAEQAEAEALTRAGMLELYDQVVRDDLAALRGMDVLTVPPDLPHLRARETPGALIPLTGDGGSMSPPPLFGPPTVGWWNVNHFDAAWPLPRRLDMVQALRRQHDNGFGPYAVHEGIPGHHLQLAMARDNPDPIRTLLWDGPAVEGWALYAEQLFWEGGGFGQGEAAHAAVLGSYRGRIRRVFYDVNVETGRWTLQQAADWRGGTAAGAGTIDPELLRAIQWPTQLISYFAGKAQIIALRNEARARGGAGWSERDFHDALLAAGPIPLALARCKVLGEPVAPPR